MREAPQGNPINTPQMGAEDLQLLVSPRWVVYCFQHVYHHMPCNPTEGSQSASRGRCLSTDSQPPCKLLVTLTLGIQVCKQYLLWGLKYIHNTYFGLFGSPGVVSPYLRPFRLMVAHIMPHRTSGHVCLWGTVLHLARHGVHASLVFSTIPRPAPPTTQILQKPLIEVRSLNS